MITTEMPKETLNTAELLVSVLYYEANMVSLKMINEDLGFTDYAAMVASGFVPWMGWKMLSCGEDCARTDNETAEK